MAHLAYIVALALMALAFSAPLASAFEEQESRLQRRETINSILGSLFESKMRERDAESDLRALPAFSKRHERSFSAPLAHPKAPISPTFHLLKVTGAKANVGTVREPRDNELKARSDEEIAEVKEALSKKYRYVEELRKQFQT
jgi:hypothetical protein